MFAAIWKTVRKAINFISYVLLATAIFFAVTGIVFPFVYGANEIMASIGRFAIAIPTFIVGGYLQLLVTPTRRWRLRHDAALIDDKRGPFASRPRQRRDSTRRTLTCETNSWRGGARSVRQGEKSARSSRWKSGPSKP